MTQIIINHADGSKTPLFSKKNISGVSKATQKIALLSEDVVSITITTATPLDLMIGDTTLIYGKKYKLNQLPQITIYFSLHLFITYMFNIDFNANDLRLIVYNIFAFAFTVFGLFLSKKIENKKVKVIYVLTIFVFNILLAFKNRRSEIIKNY